MLSDYFFINNRDIFMIFPHVQPNQIDILTLLISEILCSLSYTNCLSGVIIVFKANSWKPFSLSLLLWDLEYT